MKNSVKLFVLTLFAVSALMVTQGCDGNVKADNPQLQSNTSKAVKTADTQNKCPKAGTKDCPCPNAENCPLAGSKCPIRQVQQAPDVDQPCPQTAANGMSPGDLKKARLVSAENIELKDQIQQLNRKITKLNDEIEKEKKKNEDIRKASAQNMEFMLENMPKFDEETGKMIKENKALKDQIKALKEENQKLKDQLGELGDLL